MKNPIRLPNFLRSAGQTGKLAAWQTGRLFRKAAQSALDAVQDVLRAEVVQGNGELVREFIFELSDLISGFSSVTLNNKSSFFSNN